MFYASFMVEILLLQKKSLGINNLASFLTFFADLYFDPTAIPPTVNLLLPDEQHPTLHDQASLKDSKVQHAKHSGHAQDKNWQQRSDLKFVLQ